MCQSLSGSIVPVGRRNLDLSKRAGSTILCSTCCDSNAINGVECNARLCGIKGCKYITLQSTLIISNSKGLSELLRDIRTSTYQICRIEEKIIRITTFNKYICNWTLEIRDMLKILWKRGEIAP